MARGGKRPGAGRKPNKQKAEEAKINPLQHPKPAPYDPVIIERVGKLCELGATDIEIADFLGIGINTLMDWKNEFSEFSGAIRTGKSAADERVERSLYNRAVGYSHEAVKIFMPGGAAAPVYAKYREHVPPDVNAAKHWLNNRRPTEWREKSEVVHKHDVSELSDAELVAIIQAGGEGGNSPPGGGAGGPDRVH